MYNPIILPAAELRRFEVDLPMGLGRQLLDQAASVALNPQEEKREVVVGKTLSADVQAYLEMQGYKLTVLEAPQYGMVISWADAPVAPIRREAA